MADDLQYSSSRPDNKRKFDDPSPPAASYNSVPPPLDGLQLAKLKAQEIAAKLLSEADSKRPKVDNGSGPFDHLQKPLGQQLQSQAQAPPSSFTSYGYGPSKRIEIPSIRVGVIIGKAGETIRNLQLQSGAKIQVTRDADAEPYSLTRVVELTGTSEQISTAEQMIRNVLEEAEAGSSSVAAPRKYGGAQLGMEQFVMQIPTNKVGLIIGKGGETIKNMQASSGARIQVIPLHPPPGDMSTERTLQIDGTQEQIEAAKKLVNEIVTGENRFRNPQSGGGYSQQGYRLPRPPAVNWGPPGAPPQTNWVQPGAPPPMQQPGYAYMQPGAYPGQPPQYMSQPPYGSYPAAPGWDQSTQATQQQTGYDYYNQQQAPQQPATSAPATSAAPADSTEYSYAQPPLAYGSQGSYPDASYSQPAAGQQQAYGQESYSGGYQSQAPQTGYSQPPPTSQAGYDQSYSSAPAYGGPGAIPTQDGSGSAYAAPAGTAPVPSPAQPPASYPAQPGYAAPPTSQPGYAQPQPTTQPAYGQSPQSQKPPAAAPAPAYAQAQQPAGSQTGYAPPGGAQPGYAQMPPAQPGYAQSYQQAPPYAGAPQTAAYSQSAAYGDAYSSGGYTQPPVYNSDGAAAASATSGGVTKASPQC